MFKSLRPLTLSCAIVLLGASLAGASDRQSGLNVLVFPMLRGDQAFAVPVRDRLRQVLVGKLVAEGHAVFDDLAIDVARAKADVRRSLLTEIGKRAARANAPRYDALILVTAEITLTKGTYTSFYAVRLTGTMIDPKTGRYLADPTTMITPLRRIPATCGAECWQRRGVRQVEASGAVLGAKMASRLGRLSRSLKRIAVAPPKKKSKPPQRRLVIRGFAPHDLAEIEAYLKVMPGFVGLRRVGGKSGASIYRFDAYEGGRGLKPSLQALLAHLNVAADIKKPNGQSLTIAARPEGAGATAGSRDW